DQAAWARLKANKSKIKIIVDDEDNLQAYVPAKFSVDPGDESLAKTFLFQRGLKFEWTFVVALRGKTLRHTFRWMFKRTRRNIRLKPVTEEPQVIQYFPEKGSVTVSVNIRYGDESFEIPSSDVAPALAPTTAPASIPPAPQVRIASNPEFGIFKGLEMVEVLSFFAAAAAAILAGLTTVYLKNSGFGSFSDYVSLFAVGAGVDQGKNFVQNLARPK
ncbi:MAG TPA: hypothetical protein VG759_15875, partial [Candidatus Angelobacter sp.]|nr:hypothetical protein [Candidatus Angelobacter sp.]